MARKLGSVTRKFDAVIVEGGGSEESNVAAWWDALESEKQVSVARACGADYHVLGKWEDLIPIGQQMRIHMWYDENIFGRG